MILAPEVARELTYIDRDDELGLTVVAREHIEDRRWVSRNRLVVQDREGKFWAAFYEQGLTEMQETQPFEYHAGVEFHEVEKVPVTTYEYRRVKT